MRTFILCLILVTTSTLVGACAHREKKSRSRVYEGDSNPALKMGEESPGSPLLKR